MDPETGYDAVANVGINNGFITVITTDDIEGARTIDATGHVVAPGFIDFHSHGQEPYAFRLYARDGVTTAMDLEMGSYPIDEFYAYWEGKAPINYGSGVSHAFARLQVLDGLDAGGRSIYEGAIEKAFHDGQQWKSKLFDPKDGPTIMAAVEEGLKQGGLGISFPLGYYSVVGSPEVMAVAGLAKKYETFVTSHVRYLAQIPPSGYLGMEEMLAVAEAHDLPLYLFHVPSNCLGLTKQCLDLIDAARERGHKVVGEFYPYKYAGTYVDADYLKPGYQDRLGIQASDVIVTETGEPLTDDEFDRLRKEDPRRDLLMYTMKDEYIMEAMTRPGTVVGSDAMPYLFEDGMTGDWDKPFGLGNGHARGAGTHAKILRMVRETKAISLMEAIRKMSHGPASFVEDYVPQFKNRGRVQEGAVADITIFDPETVTDNSTPKIGENSLPSTGIPYVIVNGTVVVDDSKVQRVAPGVAIRNAIVE
jgi:dihydroorotase-like cyclic amidohydrolase